MQLLPQALVAGSVDLALLWHELHTGGLFISQSYCSRGRCYALLGPGREHPADNESVELLARFLLGERQKSLAIEHGVAISTIATQCTSALSAFINTPNASHAPILVVMAAHAARGGCLAPALVEPQALPYSWLICVTVPGATFLERLSPSEHAVARLSIEGRSYAQMARARRVSERTIANQLAACFRKLGVSGRSELRAKAVQELSQLESVRHCA